MIVHLFDKCFTRREVHLACHWRAFSNRSAAVFRLGTVRRKDVVPARTLVEFVENLDGLKKHGSHSFFRKLRAI